MDDFQATSNVTHSGGEAWNGDSVIILLNAGFNIYTASAGLWDNAWRVMPGFQMVEYLYL